MNHKDLSKQFWENHKNIKRKTTSAGELEAQKKQAAFVEDYLSDLSEEDLIDTFGDYSGFVKRWINSELITSSTGRHLYIKLGPAE